MDNCEAMESRGLGGRLVRAARIAMAAALVGVASIGLGGCNAGGNNLLEANRALQERVTTLQAENESLHNTNQQLQAALAARDKALTDLQMQMSSMSASGAGMDERYNELLRKFGGLRFGSLDPQTDAALRDLAMQHPDLLEYDPVSGVLRFKSDFTFASGSDEVNPAAKSTLRQLSAILNGAAAGYDVKVLGHTDSQPIRRVAQRHPTNMHLSAHRAISVRTELVSAGVAAERFEVAGRGEFDPLVSNNANGNTPRNRRVEIYLTNTVRRGAVSAPTETDMAPARSSTPAQRPMPREEIMK